MSVRPALLASLLFVAVVAVTGCGDGGDGGSGGIEVSGSSDEDTRIATQLRDYLERNLKPSHNSSAEQIKALCSGAQRKLREAQCEQVEALAPVYSSIRTIEVEDGVITVGTDLGDDRTGHEGAGILCQEIQGADVADFTAGHKVLDEADSVLVSCPTREQLDGPQG